jgi:hypothetical protein
MSSDNQKIDRLSSSIFSILAISIGSRLAWGNGMETVPPPVPGLFAGCRPAKPIRCAPSCASSWDKGGTLQWLHPNHCCFPLAVSPTLAQEW